MQKKRHIKKWYDKIALYTQCQPPHGIYTAIYYRYQGTFQKNLKA